MGKGVQQRSTFGDVDDDDDGRTSSSSSPEATPSSSNLLLLELTTTGTNLLALLNWCIDEERMCQMLCPVHEGFCFFLPRACRYELFCRKQWLHGDFVELGLHL
jgi:hypothetical protein